MSQRELQSTSKSRLVRKPDRGSYDREIAYEIIDSTPLCHVAYVIDGEPYITPTMQWREGDNIYWHGSSASRFLRSSTGANVSINVVLFDGVVLARSGFHHTANYRSVTIFGEASKVEGEEKNKRLQGFIDTLLPGRWETLRPMTEQEILATTVLTTPIEEASVKIRKGGPVDLDEDYDIPIWAGVLPVGQTVGEPIPDDRNLAGIEIPVHVRRFKVG